MLRENIADNQKESVIRNVANSKVKDGVHLTPRGYELLAQLIARKIKAADLPASKVACFGDSLTKGSAKANYPAYLDAILDGKNAP